MSEMVDRVARAIGAECVKTNPRKFSVNWPWLDISDGDAALDLPTVASAAIEAMREPTEAMVEASNREWDGRMSHRSSGAWQAMIDKALE